MHPLLFKGFVYINKAVGVLQGNAADAEDFMSIACVFEGLSSE